MRENINQLPTKLSSHSNAQTTPASPITQPQLEITGSRQFNSWLAEQELSLVFTTYQAGKVFFLGLQTNGKLSVFERSFNRCMGLWT